MKVFAELDVRKWSKAGGMVTGAYGVAMCSEPRLSAIHVKAFESEVVLTYSLDFKGVRTSFEKVSRHGGTCLECPTCGKVSYKFALTVAAPEKGFRCIACHGGYLKSEFYGKRSHKTQWERLREKAAKLRVKYGASLDEDVNEIPCPKGARPVRFLADMDKVHDLEAEAERLFREYLSGFIGKAEGEKKPA